jgi:hypothetical protein
MTDAGLAHRAEQALLGAMIARPGQAIGLPGTLTPEHFTDQRHQAICAALTGTGLGEQGRLGWLRDLLTRLGKRSRQTAAYMAALPSMCPAPEHMASYYQMVSQAKAQREAGPVAAEAAGDELARAAAQLASAAAQLAGQAARSGKTGNAPGELPAGVTRLARALGTTARQLSTEQQPARPAAPAGAGTPPPVPDQEPVRAGQDDRPAAGPASEPAAVTRTEDLEDLVLAAVMRHPEQAREVLGWLPAAAFSQGPRRDLYQLAGDLIKAREKTDPLIIAWAVGRRLDDRQESAALGDEEGRVTPGFVLRVAELPAVPETAAAFGKVLLAQHVCATRWGETWYKSPQLTRPAASGPAASRGPAVVPGQQQAPEQAPAPAVAAPAVARADEHAPAMRGAGRMPAARELPLQAPPPGAANVPGQDGISPRM